jgi:anti-sigma factor RsiW
MNGSAAARLQCENEALVFECETLRREAKRLVAVNRALEARLALVSEESDRLRSYLEAIKRSRPWRVVQTLRGWLGRRW